MPLKLHPQIKDLNTLVMYESDCNKAKLKFARNTVIGCDRLKELVMMDPYNSLEVDIHKDIVGSICVFMLVIYARHEDHSKNVTILGISPTI